MEYLGTDRNGQCLLNIYVQPKASKNKIVGLHGEELKVATTAPPVDGKANKAIIAFLAKFFGLSKSTITLIRGQHSRHKQLSLAGITADEAREMIENP